MPHPHNWAQSAPAPLVATPATLPPLEMEAPKSDEDVERDLQALFAIRDAAMAATARRAPARGEQPDFQPTQPFDDGKPPRQ